MTRLRVLVNGLNLAQPMSGVRRHAEQVLPRAAQLLQEAGGELAVLVPRAGLGYPLAHTRQVRVPLSGSFTARLLRETQALERAIEEAGPFEVLHTSHLPARATPWTAHVHLQHDVRRASSSLGRAFLRAMAARADHVVAVSRATANELTQLTSPRALSVVPHGGDHLPWVEPSRSGRPFVLVPGHLIHRKDPFTAVRALAVDRHLPTLLFAGAAPGSVVHELQGLAHELGVHERVRYAGPIPDAELAQLYATCRAVLLPSRLEGFNLPILEARRAGAPLVVSAIPAHAEVAGLHAKRFDVGDAEGCARAVQEALSSPCAPTQVPTWEDAACALVAAWRSAWESFQAP